jgi:hypothetical protein
MQAIYALRLDDFELVDPRPMRENHPAGHTVDGQVPTLDQGIDWFGVR